jgi:Homeodomain-like domain
VSTPRELLGIRDDLAMDDRRLDTGRQDVRTRLAEGCPMVRKYERKPGRVNPDRRMARAVELRAEGLSLRQIAERLVCSEITVRRDLARWEQERPNVTPLRHSPATFSPPRGKDVAPESTTEPSNIISLSDRRKRA